jgi:ubiquinone/menaquinone biosynthesis C-methylase UbiE
MDACNMNFAKESFNLIFDKATLDTIRCSFNFHFQVEQYLKEIFRVLSPGGTFICVTNGNPNVIMKYLKHEELNWNVEVRHINKIKPNPTREGTQFILKHFP